MPIPTPLLTLPLMARRERTGRDGRRRESDDAEDSADRGPVEIALVGDLTDNEADITDRLLGIDPGGECTIYFDSPGGSPYHCRSRPCS